VLRPQGRRGEVLAKLHTDFPERFNERRQLSGLAADGSRRELRLEEHWLHKGGVVLKFAGVESISDAGQLAGLELQVPSDERTKLEAGAAYIS
jgi:16S rRNA processing protein RimM